MNISYGQVPAYHAERLGPDRWAIKHGDEVVTWGELDDRSTRRAWALKAAGVRQDDLVTLSIPNSAAIYEFTFAIWKLGATPHVVSWRLPRAELNATLEVARPKLIIASEPSLREGIGAKGPEFGTDYGQVDPLPPTTSRYWKALSSGGSTGRPKVVVDHAPAMIDPSEPSPLHIPADSVVLNPGPTYHSAPFGFSHIALFRGNSVVGMSKFDAEEALRLIAENGVTWVNWVPTMMQRIWRLPEATRRRYDLSSLKWVWHMAAPMPPWLKEAWIGWLGPERIFELYGGTERLGATTITGPEWLRHRGSVGRPMDCQLKVMRESGEPAPTGEVGEVFFLPSTGAGTTYHYLGAESLSRGEGWETLGDFGWLDEDGYLFIADRRTDLILAGGANIYPAEVEAALMEHPKVEVAVVVGLPHEDLGQAVHAIIRPAAGCEGRISKEELLDFLGERLVRYKIPRSLEFTTEPLRDDAGKVRRTALRDERIALRGQ